MLPTAENLKALRQVLGKTQGKMADLCGYPWEIDKSTGSSTELRPSAKMWRQLTAPEGSKARRKMTPEAFFHLAAHLSINGDELGYITEFSLQGIENHDFYKMLNSQQIFFAKAHYAISREQLFAIMLKMETICSLTLD